MESELEASKPFPVVRVLVAACLLAVGAVVLFDSLRPRQRRTLRMTPLMDTRVGRACGSIWCLSMAAVGLGRASRLPLVTLHEIWFYIAGFGSFACGLGYGYLAHKLGQRGR
jgi:hypothetical protein